MSNEILDNFKASASLLLETGEQCAGKITEIASIIIQAYQQGNKVLIAGNGGSAADAQHIAGELVNTFLHERKALAALALSTDTSVLTAWANDKSFDAVFERQIEAHGKPGDIFIAISTSGNSQNLLRAAQKANQIGLTTISLLGKGGGKMKGLCNHEIIVPSPSTPRIQEAHKVIYHSLCEQIEKAFLT